MPKETRQCEVSAEQTGRIDRVIQSMTGLSRSRVQGLFDQGCVRCNDEPCTNVAQRVTMGDQVQLDFDPGQGYRPAKKQWTDRTFSILLEDDAVLIVNKSAKVLTVEQDNGLDRNTLEERVAIYLKAKARRKPILMNRLDRGMSGIVVFAKTPEAAAGLQPQFAQHQTRRRFTAVVAGADLPEKGEVQSYVAVGENLDQYSTNDPTEGELSTTFYQRLQVLSGATLISAHPQQGQPNHIRLHMAEEGFPVLGDKRYIRKITAHMRRRETAEALERYQHPGWNKSFMAMHASHLSLQHPSTGKKINLEATLPKAMSVFIRGHRPQV